MKPHRLLIRFCCNNMLDISGAVESASLFAGAMGLLFANWNLDIEKAVEIPIPQHYADRELYFKTVYSIMKVKSFPLSIVFIAFAYSMAPVFIGICTGSDFFDIFRDDVKYLNMEWTIFVIVYSIITYFGFVSVKGSVKLIAALARARKGRAKGQPRVHLLG